MTETIAASQALDGACGPGKGDGTDGNAPDPQALGAATVATVRIAERYRDLGRIGLGGMGEVRRVWDERLDRPAAMKLLGWHLVDDAEARERFQREAVLTARLQHPGVVAVHDHGELPGGRLWYAMAEVRGQTLEQAVDQAHAPALGHAELRRLVGLVLRACETVGYAHEQGVVHRDLKPSNLMIGPFGELLVLDWGLATDAAAPARPAGTPGYMPPEQRRGRVTPAPAADVFALGGVLGFAISGRSPPRDEGDWPDPSEVPAELLAICRRARDPLPERRFPNAGALSEAVAAWLHGALRVAEADTLVEQATAQREAHLELVKRAQDLRRRAAHGLGSLQPFGGADGKLPFWEMEDEASTLTRDAALAEARWMETVRGALHLVPEHGPAHALLASHYQAALLQAEARRDAAGASCNEALLRVHDRGRYAPWLSDLGTVTLHTDPPGAEVEVLRYALRGRREVALPTGWRWTTPVEEETLPLGSYLLRVTSPGRRTLLVPVELRRGQPWTGIRPDDTVPHTLRLVAPDELGDESCVVPAGWFWAGGDEAAGEALPSRRVWVPSFAIARHPVTHAAYVDFLNEQIRVGRTPDALAWAPRHPLAQTGAREVSLLYDRDPDGLFRPTSATLPLDPGAPVTMIDWRSASAYAAWTAARTGQPWRLPDELEWEKAARGVDGRTFVWGDQPEASWANVLGSSAADPAPCATDRFPTDESPYGVRGLSGNVRDWCCNVWGPDGPPVESDILQVTPASSDDAGLRAVRGGAWQASISQARAASRFADLPSLRLGPVGFRLARDLV